MTTFEDVRRASGLPSPEHNSSGWIVALCIVIGVIVLVLTKCGFAI